MGTCLNTSHKQRIKMKEIVNKFLLAEDKCMKIVKFKETGNASYIYKSELDKACFQHDLVYGDLKI